MHPNEEVSRMRTKLIPQSETDPGTGRDKTNPRVVLSTSAARATSIAAARQAGRLRCFRLAPRREGQGSVNTGREEVEGMNRRLIGAAWVAAAGIVLSLVLAPAATASTASTTFVQLSPSRS